MSTQTKVKIRKLLVFVKSDIPSEKHFHENLTIRELNNLLSEENHENSCFFGLFYTDKDHSIRWLDDNCTIDSIINDMNNNSNLQLHWKKKRRPIRILLSDETFRTHLIDDSWTVSKIIQEIGSRYGLSCTVDITNFERNSYEILSKNLSLRDQGYPANLKAGIIAKDKNRNLFVVVPYCEGKLYVRINNKWKRYYGELKKDIFNIYTYDKVKINQIINAHEIKSITYSNTLLDKKYPINLEILGSKTIIISGKYKIETQDWLKELNHCHEMFTKKPSFFAIPKGYKPICSVYKRYTTQLPARTRKSSLLRQNNNKNKTNTMSALKRTVSKQFPKIYEPHNKLYAPPNTPNLSPKDDSIFPNNIIQRKHSRRKSLTDFDITEMDDLSQIYTSTEASDFYKLSDSDDDDDIYINFEDDNDNDNIIIDIQDTNNNINTNSIEEIYYLLIENEDYIELNNTRIFNNKNITKSISNSIQYNIKLNQIL